MKTLLILFTFSILISAQEIQDGNWWLKQNYKTKTSYVIGYNDGMFLGRLFDTFNLDSTAKEQVNKSYDYCNNKFLFNVSIGQICEGLDSLYADYRNRNILVQLGIWAVLNSIHGISQPDYEQMLERLRKITVKE
jgi:hypothetical protein